MNSPKIIEMPSVGKDVPIRDKYIESLRGVSDELQAIAMVYGESPKSVLADLTYVVVGDDIMAIVSDMDDGK